MHQTKINRLPEVLQRTGLSSPTIYRLIKAGKFPKPIKLTERSSGWLASDVEKFIADSVKASRPETRQGG